MRREKLLELAKKAGLLIDEDKHISGHVFSTTILGRGDRFVCIRDDGAIMRDWPTGLGKRISVKEAAEYIKEFHIS